MRGIDEFPPSLTLAPSSPLRRALSVRGSGEAPRRTPSASIRAVAPPPASQSENLGRSSSPLAGATTIRKSFKSPPYHLGFETLALSSSSKSSKPPPPSVDPNFEKLMAIYNKADRELRQFRRERKRLEALTAARKLGIESAELHSFHRCSQCHGFGHFEIECPTPLDYFDEDKERSAFRAQSLVYDEEQGKVNFFMQQSVSEVVMSSVSDNSTADEDKPQEQGPIFEEPTGIKQTESVNPGLEFSGQISGFPSACELAEAPKEVECDDFLNLMPFNVELNPFCENDPSCVGTCVLWSKIEFRLLLYDVYKNGLSELISRLGYSVNPMCLSEIDICETARCSPLLVLTRNGVSRAACVLGNKMIIDCENLIFELMNNVTYGNPARVCLCHVNFELKRVGPDMIFSHTVLRSEMFRLNNVCLLFGKGKIKLDRAVYLSLGFSSHLMRLSCVLWNGIVLRILLYNAVQGLELSALNNCVVLIRNFCCYVVESKFCCDKAVLRWLLILWPGCCVKTMCLVNLEVCRVAYQYFPLPAFGFYDRLMSTEGLFVEVCSVVLENGTLSYAWLFESSLRLKVNISDYIALIFNCLFTAGLSSKIWGEFSNLSAALRFGFTSFFCVSDAIGSVLGDKIGLRLLLYDIGLPLSLLAMKKTFVGCLRLPGLLLREFAKCHNCPESNRVAKLVVASHLRFISFRSEFHGYDRAEFICHCDNLGSNSTSKVPCVSSLVKGSPNEFRTELGSTNQALDALHLVFDTMDFSSTIRFWRIPQPFRFQWPAIATAKGFHDVQILNSSTVLAFMLGSIKFEKVRLIPSPYKSDPDSNFGSGIGFDYSDHNSLLVSNYKLDLLVCDGICYYVCLPIEIGIILLLYDFFCAMGSPIRCCLPCLCRVVVLTNLSQAIIVQLLAGCSSCLTSFGLNFHELNIASLIGQYAYSNVGFGNVKSSNLANANSGVNSILGRGLSHQLLFVWHIHALLVDCMNLKFCLHLLVNTLTCIDEEWECIKCFGRHNCWKFRKRRTLHISI